VGTLSTAELRGFYAEYVAAWNCRDMERYYSLHSENLVFQGGVEVLRGVDALRERYESELAAFPDLTGRRRNANPRGREPRARNA